MVCERCKGSGYITEEEVREGRKITIFRPCPICNSRTETISIEELRDVIRNLILNQFLKGKGKMKIIDAIIDAIKPSKEIIDYFMENLLDKKVDWRVECKRLPTKINSVRDALFIIAVIEFADGHYRGYIDGRKDGFDEGYARALVELIAQQHPLS